MFRRCETPPKYPDFGEKHAGARDEANDSSFI